MNRLRRARAWLLAPILLLTGCNHRENPYGPKKAPALHYQDCANRCTELDPWGPHVKRQ
ncbi:MAG: hypothetical protein M9894_13390 [Planctomycetes bacterium]|nr:hypothetical protein [Planctomycetota bacterium]